MINSDFPTVKIIKSKCDLCNEMAETRVLTIKYPKVPPEVVSIFECKKCNSRETSVFEDHEDNRGKIKITCELTDKNDLQRYVYLNQDAKVSFYDMKGSLLYEYKTFSSETTVIEILLSNVIEKITEFYGLAQTSKDRAVTTSSTRKPTNGSGYSTKEQKNAMESVELLKAELKEPNLKMIILDSSGISRVGPLNQQFPPDFLKKEIKEYNDEKVKHVFVD